MLTADAAALQQPAWPGPCGFTRSDEDRRISGLFERNNFGDEDYEIKKLEKITEQLSKLHKEFQDMEEQDTKEGHIDHEDEGEDNTDNTY